MISTSVKGKWKTKEELEVLSNSKTLVVIEGLYIDTREYFSGEPKDIQYGRVVLVKDGGKQYFFSKRTDNTVKVD